jgi:hypothetical protein
MPAHCSPDRPLQGIYIINCRFAGPDNVGTQVGEEFLLLGIPEQEHQ